MQHLVQPLLSVPPLGVKQVRSETFNAAATWTAIQTNLSWLYLEQNARTSDYLGRAPAGSDTLRSYSLFYEDS